MIIRQDEFPFSPSRVWLTFMNNKNQLNESGIDVVNQIVMGV